MGDVDGGSGCGSIHDINKWRLDLQLVPFYSILQINTKQYKVIIVKSNSHSDHYQTTLNHSINYCIKLLMHY